MSGEKAAARGAPFFDDLWRRGDPWELETSDFERAKYASQMALIADRRYGRILEIGCGAGVFTRQLAGLGGSVVAVDVSDAAIQRARAHGTVPNVEYRVADIVESTLCEDGPWDLVVFAETICYVGWLRSFFDVAWLAHRLLEGTRPGGRLLLANTCGGVEDYLLMPWIIHTYRDLFVNAGFGVEREEVFRGTKSGAEITALLTLFERPA